MAFNVKTALLKPALKLAMERSGHGRQLGIDITHVSGGHVRLAYSYDPQAVGNPLTGVIHGGVILSLLDICCGCAAMTAMQELSIAPTIDLRLDYMQPAKPEKPVLASGNVYRTTSSVIFCRGSAWQDDEDDPIAHCVATFMRLSAPQMSIASVIRTGIQGLFPAGKDRG
ncbi:MAG TPA: hypothetical protein DD440_02945 [Porticoccaceae bacterium]|nr:hypothetical protein [Porticoccaceae bacterium]